MAIPNTPQYTITKTVIGPDGTVQTVLVDPTTDQPISGSGQSGFDAISNGQNYWNPPTPSKTSEQTTSQQILEETQKPRGGENQGFMAGEPMQRDMTNNFGYFEKPGLVKAMGFVPGPIGTIGKVANIGFNANNMAAVDQARETIGLDGLSPMGQLRGFMKDNKGQVANATINNQNYSVGFNALSPDGRTNLTPNEARQRALTLGGIQETPKDVVKQDVQQFRKDNPNARTGVIQGLYNDVKQTAKSFVDSLFNFGTQDTGSRSGSFPNAPAQAGYDGKSYSALNRGYDTPSEGRASRGSYSPSADHAIGSGKDGGLY